MIKDIKYQGYSAVPSDYESMDGELAGSYNMIPEDGAMHPVFPPQELFTLPSGYKLMLLHHPTEDVNNYILYNPTTRTLAYTTGHGTTITVTDIGTLTAGTELYQINTVGNTLLALTSKGTYYYLWKNGAYTALGNKIPEVFMSFSLEQGNYVGPTDNTNDMIKLSINGNHSDIDPDDPKECTIGGVTFCNLYWMQRYFLVPYSYYNLNPSVWYDGEDFQEEGEKIIYSDAIKAKANSIIANEVTGKGMFCMPFFVRYAMRLYDDSLVMHSAPVLMLPSQIQALVHDLGSGYTDANRYYIKVGVNPCKLQYQLQQFSTATFNNWKDIIKSVDIFISAPIWDYDQAGFADKMLSGGYSRRSVTKDVSGYKPIPLTGDGIRNLHDNTRCSMPQHDRESFVKSIEECGNFYLLHSYTIDELSSLTFTNNLSPRTDIVIPDDYLQSLQVREVMTDDYQSHDTLITRQSYNFNGRINLAYIKRQLYSGYNPWTAICFNNNDSSDQYVSAYVEIYDEGHTIVVKHDAVTEINATSMSLRFDANGIVWYYYPDPKAKKAVIKIGSTLYELPLKPHPLLNGAYYFNALSGPATTSTEPTVSQDNTISIPNKIYTSEINNPFFFPLNMINTVGTGKILGICAAVKALSQGQFGQFPLYCFTTEGVWALETSSTGSYVARQPITRDVCTNVDSITQLDDCVTFATDRGIMLLSGSTSQCITDAINSEFSFKFSDLFTTEAAMTQWNTFLTNNNYSTSGLTQVPFSTFLSGCRMIYDYVHQRIVVYNTSQDYAYIYSLKDHKWGMMQTDIDYGINSYPEALAVTDSNKVVNLSKDKTVEVTPAVAPATEPTTTPIKVKGILVTRPLKLDQPDALKTIDTIIQRGKFDFLKPGRTVKPIRTILYGSRDLYNWFMIYSSTDHQLRGFSGSPYKYFRIVALVDFLPDESVYGATIQYNPRYLNRPR